MKYGYIRVSTTGQNTARQDVLMQQLGVDRVFTDKLSGKSADRPQLHAMMEVLQPGDTVIVESISRFARNTKDLLELVERLTEKSVEFVSKKENIDTTTPTGHFMLTIFGAVAELERNFILERQAEGIAIARANGRYTGKNHNGRKRKQVDCSIFENCYQLNQFGTCSQREAAELLDISQPDVCRRFAERSLVGEKYNPNQALGAQGETA